MATMLRVNWALGRLELPAEAISIVAADVLGLKGPGWLRLSVLQPGGEALLELASEAEVPPGRLRRTLPESCCPRGKGRGSGAGQLCGRGSDDPAASSADEGSASDSGSSSEADSLCGEEDDSSEGGKGEKAVEEDGEEQRRRGPSGAGQSKGGSGSGRKRCGAKGTGAVAGSDDDVPLAQRLVKLTSRQPRAPAAVERGGSGSARVRSEAELGAVVTKREEGQGLKGRVDAPLGCPPGVSPSPCERLVLTGAGPWADGSKASVSGGAAVLSPLQPAAAPTATLPTSAQHQPAAYLTHLHGFVPPSVGLPPLQPGQSLSRAVVCNKLARLLGLEGDNGRSEAPLPEGPVVLEGAMQPCGDPTRGGAGLQVSEALKKNTVLGVVGGYVMPVAAAEDFVNFGHKQCRKELSMLGFGNLLALVNDPRVDPREWRTSNDVDSPEVAKMVNCTVVPVSVRGMVLPVLVALRDIAAGDQLLRDYGAGWWRQLAPDWEVAEDDGLDVVRLLHGTQQQQQAQSAKPDPLSVAQPLEEVPEESVVASRLNASPPALPFTAEASTGPFGTAASAPQPAERGTDESKTGSRASSCPDQSDTQVRSPKAAQTGAAREALRQDGGGAAPDAAGGGPAPTPAPASATRAELPIAVSKEGRLFTPAEGRSPLYGLVAALGESLGLIEEVRGQLAKPLGFLGPASVVAAAQLLERHGLPYAKGAVLRVKWAPGIKLRLDHVASKTGPPKWGDVRVTAHFGELLDDLAAAGEGQKHKLTLWVYSLTTLAPSLELELDPTSLGAEASAEAAGRLQHGGGSAAAPLHGGVAEMYIRIHKQPVPTTVTEPPKDKPVAHQPTSTPAQPLPLPQRSPAALAHPYHSHQPYPPYPPHYYPHQHYAHHAGGVAPYPHYAYPGYGYAAVGGWQHSGWWYGGAHNQAQMPAPLPSVPPSVAAGPTVAAGQAAAAAAPGAAVPAAAAAEEALAAADRTASRKGTTRLNVRRQKQLQLPEAVARSSRQHHEYLDGGSGDDAASGSGVGRNGDIHMGGRLGERGS
ncbi:hypothetical protein GPECTOR_30g194 [Gonium pectorale]|uniref:SET domain-containing protein n=1 Tax=Gonium pectorale TaxID=33097 RepID=A0A150GE34_GONPE|nr:hypothetical protein GPECTOR_30g194 [Gonium pectorale]|eukprot:KXZ48099.1 hypothetical protein GPECTOR_30g194 [Gonium pectorale]